MNDELKAYLRIESKLAAAFNFFISGMIAALIFHSVDKVPTDVISIAIDIIITCLFTFTITAYFCRACLKANKVAGILSPVNGFIRFLVRIFRVSLGFGVLPGLASAVILFIIIASGFTLLNIIALPFYPYVLLKSLFSMLLGGGAALLNLYAGMCKTD